MSLLKPFKTAIGFGSILVLTSCLQQDFGGPKKSTSASVTTSSEFTTEKIDAFQKLYPDLQKRSVEAFKITLHPLLMRSCGGCHTSTSSSQARTIPHSDVDPEKAYEMVAAKGLFDLKSATNSDIFHVRDRHLAYGVDLKNLNGSPFDPSASGGASLRWVVAIQNFSILVGDLPKSSISKSIALSSTLYGQMKKDNVDKDLPEAGMISIANLPENATGGGVLNFKFTASVEADGYYRISNLTLQSDVTTHQLKIEGVDVFLNGKKISNASSFRPLLPYKVLFTAADKPEPFTGTAAVMIAPEVDATKCLQNETVRCSDLFSFEFRGMKWEPRSSVPPNQMVDYRNTRRLAAMTALKNKCSGCHGLGGNSGGAFPGAPNLESSTDSMWMAANKWIIPGEPNNSNLMQRLTAVTAGGPTITSTKNKNMPLNRPAISLKEIYDLNDWILLMKDPDKTTFLFQIPSGTKSSTTGNWNTPQSAIQLKVGDTLFLRNLDTSNHAIHTMNGRPFKHQEGETAGCSTGSLCGSSRLSIMDTADSLPEPTKTKDTIYDHSRESSKAGSIYMVVTKPEASK